MSHETIKFKQTKKGFTHITDTFSNAANYLLKQIEEKHIQSISKDLKKFIDEAVKFDKNREKTYSPDRAVKLYGILKTFLDINSINKEPIETVLNGFRGVATSDASIYFSECFDEVYKLIENSPYRDFLEARLYFVDDEIKERIVSMQNKLSSLVETKNEKKIYSFKRVVNLLNGDNFSHKYKVTYLSKYQYISSPESLLFYLPAHYEITKNKIIKYHNELLRTHKFSLSTKKQIENEHKIELSKAEDEYNYLIGILEDNKTDDIDIKIVSYDHSNIYPQIRYVIDSGRTNYAHLRSEVINILWYKSKQLQKDMIASDIVTNYNHAFGDVYYLENI